MKTYKIDKIKTIILLCSFLLCTVGCEDINEVPPNIEDEINQNFVIPTYRLTYEEMDIINTQRKAYQKAIDATRGAINIKQE